MSKIGRQPIEIPDSVTVQLEGRKVTIKGKEGELSFSLPISLKVKVDNKQILISPEDNSRQTKALWGTWRSLLANAVQGVEKGWEKTLQVVGTGYKAQLDGEAVIFRVGFSHQVKIEPPDGVKFVVNGDLVTVRGADRQLVGEVAAKMRRLRPPDPYKGKGIRYQNEVVKLKPGKVAKAGA